MSDACDPSACPLTNRSCLQLVLLKGSVWRSWSLMPRRERSLARSTCCSGSSRCAVLGLVELPMPSAAAVGALSEWTLVREQSRRVTALLSAQHNDQRGQLLVTVNEAIGLVAGNPSDPYNQIQRSKKIMRKISKKTIKKVSAMKQWWDTLSEAWVRRGHHRGPCSVVRAFPRLGRPYFMDRVVRNG